MTNPAINTDFKIATYASGIGALATLASLSIPNPHPVYKAGTSVVKLGDNSARILGSPILIWHWGFITQNQRDILREYCTGASAQVYIATPTTEKVLGISNATKNYLCQMWWPAPSNAEDPQTGRRIEFSIMFKQLVVQ